MKKITLVMSAIIMAALLAVSAFAAPVVFEADSENAFDITYTGTEGQYYAIVIVEGIVEEGGAPSITEESIQYINQQTAGVDGAVSFEDVLLRVDGTEATVFLGGSDIDDGPVLLGWVNKSEEVTTFTVSGTVTSVNNSAATVTLYNANEEEVASVATVDGAYAVDVAAGTYKLVVTKAKHLSYTKNALEVTENKTQNATLLGGNYASSNPEVIAYADLSPVLLNYSKANADYDISGDGVVGYADLSPVLLNYGKSPVAE